MSSFKEYVLDMIFCINLEEINIPRLKLMLLNKAGGSNNISKRPV